jgi:hypothetical protein
MTGPAGPVGGRRRRVIAESNHPALVAGRERRASLYAISGRWAAVLAVAATVAVLGLLDAVLPTSSAAPTPGLFDGVAVPPGGAYSTSAFCPASTGTTAARTIYLTNSSPEPVEGVMTSVAPATGSGAVPTVHRTVTVPALGTAAVNPATGLPAGDNASTFVFAGGGVVANQVASGPGGWSTAPCASQTAAQWSFVGGSTTAGHATSIALLNPSSTEAVVNISFLTGQGRVTPQSYQGLVVPPGQLVVENVGDFVQDATAIATFVVAQAGTVVASDFQQSSGSARGMALELGAPALSTTWRLGQTTSLTGSTVDFTMANPGNAPVTATVTVGLPSGSVVPRQAVVPPQSTTVFAASAPGGLPKQVPYSVTVRSTGPIVVGRSVQAGASAPEPVWGASGATTVATTRWLVTGPGVPGAPGTAGATVDSLALADPGPTPARVTVAVLGSGRALAVVTVGPGRVTVLGPKVVGGLPTLTVSATQPVFVEEDSAPSGAPGVVSSAGFPFAGSS